jgi:hypothetical protein
MFYCDACARQNGWPIELFGRSWGGCEMCGKQTSCNDVPSTMLPRNSKEGGGA